MSKFRLVITAMVILVAAAIVTAAPSTALAAGDDPTAIADSVAVADTSTADDNAAADDNAGAQDNAGDDNAAADDDTGAVDSSSDSSGDCSGNDCSPCTTDCTPCENDCTPCTTNCEPKCGDPGQPACPTDCTATDTCPPEDCTATDSCPPEPCDEATEDCTPTPKPAKGSGTLPFTGPGDMYAALLLAMLAGTGGLALMLHASTLDRLLAAARRTMRSSSGFHDVARSELGEDFEGLDASTDGTRLD